MRAIALIAIVVVLVWPARALLVRARWTAFTPRAAVVLWQAIGVAVGVALIGACFEVAGLSSGANPRRNVSDFSRTVVAMRPTKGLTPNQVFGVTAGIIAATIVLGTLILRAVIQMQARARYRMLVDLVGDERQDVPGALILNHPRAAAYAVPGLRSRIVVSSGAIAALSQDELDAVLAHERAHLRARHDLVLLPFRALCAVFPRSRSVAAVGSNVEVLLEMAADDRALRESEPSSLARALCRMAIADSQPTALGATVNIAARRVERALAPREGTKLLAVGTGLSTLGILALPFVALFASFGR